MPGSILYDRKRKGSISEPRGLRNRAECRCVSDAPGLDESAGWVEAPPAQPKLLVMRSHTSSARVGRRNRLPNSSGPKRRVLVPLTLIAARRKAFSLKTFMDSPNFIGYKELQSNSSNELLLGDFYLIIRQS